MLKKIADKIELYINTQDVHQFQLILDASLDFIKALPNGVNNSAELILGIELLRQLNSVTMITSLHEYENNFDLQNEILFKKLAVFRICIPSSHSSLRGLTETLVGMKENEMTDIVKSLLKK